MRSVVGLVFSVMVTALGCTSSSSSSTSTRTSTGAAGPSDAGGRLVSEGAVSPETSDAIAGAASRSVPAGYGNPTEVALPAVADSETATWLTGPAQPLAEAVGVSVPLWRDGDSSCQAVAAELDGLGTPETLAGYASGTPDEATRELLLGLLTTIGESLASCGSEAFDAEVAELAWQWSITERRLVELGVHR